MINITVIGKMGTGKTTLIKQYSKERRRVIFDVNAEYKELGTDNRKAASRMIDLDHKVFIELTLNKRNTVCVFEDATGFIEGRLSDNFRKALVSKRHTGNVNILVFHSIGSVPPRLLQLSDYIILFRTSDEAYQVEKKYPSLYKDYLYVKKNSEANPHFYKTIKL